MSTAEQRQAEADREAILASLPSLLDPVAAAADIFTLPVRGGMGALNTLLRLPNAAGAGIPYIPEEAFGGSSSSLTPYYDRLRAARGASPAPRAAGLEGGVDSSALVADAPRAPNPAAEIMRREAASRGGAAPRPGVENANDRAQMESVALGMQELAKQKAAAMAMPNARGSQEDAYNALLAATKRNRADPMGAALSRGVLEFGGRMLDNQGNFGPGVMSSATKAYRDTMASEDARYEKDYDRTLSQGLARLGFREKDADRKDMQSKAEMERKFAELAAAGIPLEMAMKSLQREQSVRDKDKELANRLQAAGISAGPRTTPLSSVEGLLALGDKVGGVEKALAMMHPRTETKLDETGRKVGEEALAGYNKFLPPDGTPARARFNNDFWAAYMVNPKAALAALPQEVQKLQGNK